MKLTIFVAVLALSVHSARAQTSPGAAEGALGIIPRPSHLESRAGSFTLGPSRATRMV